MKFKLNKNERYIFATDLDGTFLHPFNHSIHINSFEAVEKIKEAGHHFVITTGRSWWWAQTIYEQLGSVDASVHFSGAFVHHPHDEEFDTFRQGISQVVIKDLVSKLPIWDYSIAVQAVGRKKHATWNKGDDLSKIFFNAYEYIIMVDENLKSSDEVLKEISEIIGDGYELRVWKGMEHYKDVAGVVISPEGTTKSEGLKRVAEYYDVPKENVIYFGDNVNDLDALIWAGHSYAPSNAIQDAKDAADELLDQSCYEGSVPNKIIELIEEQNEDN